MKISHRLIIFIVVAVAVAGITSYIGITNVAKLNAGTELFTDVYVPSVEQILNADRDLYQAELERMKLADLTPGSEEWDACIASMDENTLQVVERTAGYAETATTAEQEQFINAHVSARDTWKQAVNEYISNLEKGTPEGCRLQRPWKKIWLSF